MKVISTWFYEHGENEPGQYAQVRGDVRDEDFRDIYRRCIAVFFHTARSVEPNARLILFLNKPWSESSSEIALEVAAQLRRLDVELAILPYSHEPPTSWPAAWRNQFFVLDVLAWGGAHLGSSDQLLVLDSDIIWTGSESTPLMWREIRERGAITLRIPYPEDHKINGLTRRELTNLVDTSRIAAVEYSGGEFIGVDSRMMRPLYDAASRILREQFLLSGGGAEYSFEEAHVLSLAYDELQIEVGRANLFLRRLWTQPLKPRNTQSSDLDLALWHVPAEKKYGIRRIYNRYNRVQVPKIRNLTIQGGSEAQRRSLGKLVGIPRNGMVKWSLDVLFAARSRVKSRVAR